VRDPRARRGQARSIRLRPTPLRAVFSRPRGPKEGSTTKTASLRRASVSKNLREDSLPISSSEVQTKTRRLRRRYFRLLKRLQREKRLNDSGLHVKSSWAEGLFRLPAGKASWRVSGGVDRIVVAQYQELARRARYVRRLSESERSPRCFCEIRSTRTPCLFHSSTMTPQQRSAAAFSRLEIPQSRTGAALRSICGQARLQEAQELLGEMGIRHGAEMLSMRRDQSNQAKLFAAREKTRGLTHRLRRGQETAVSRQEPRIAEGGGSHIIRSLPG